MGVAVRVHGEGEGVVVICFYVRVSYVLVTVSGEGLIVFFCQVRVSHFLSVLSVSVVSVVIVFCCCCWELQPRR